MWVLRNRYAAVAVILWAGVGAEALAQGIEFGPPQQPAKRARPDPVPRPSTAVNAPPSAAIKPQPAKPLVAPAAANAAPTASPPAAAATPVEVPVSPVGKAKPQQSAPETAALPDATGTHPVPALAANTVTAAPALPPPPAPANCKNTGAFDAWLSGFKKEAAANGVSAQTISSALGGMTLDGGIIGRDRKQQFFTQTFLDFSGKLANPSRLNSSIFKVNKNKAIFKRAEADYGVPAPVITAFWALESDFGSGMGNLPVLRSLATLAYDCRRAPMFRAELMAALKIIDRGDLSAGEMIGSWAGELGQTQFLPQHYFNYAVDYDGDGRRDLLRSNPDIIASTANFIKSLGWQAGEPWLREVRVPGQLPWDQADLVIKHPIAKWREWGVTAADGLALADEGPPASLILPMGRKGPAFLAYPNFDIYLKWNQSLTYGITAAYLATRIGGAPAMSRGSGAVASLDGPQIKELQSLLNHRGYPNGEPDGKLGAGTRSAVKQAQQKFGMPADSYPTPELLAALRRGG